jgi:tetratricopeptide (TPR) repeat protein
VQAFAAGLDSLDAWNLAGADKAFEHATVLDAGFARARFWQAQVRSWRRQSVESWRSLAGHAAADSTRLPGRERELARALNALGAGEFKTACDDYNRLANANPSDFAAWYGLGQCNDFDYQLVADGHGGLRYRSSYQEAMRAYRRAFSVLAISHRGVQGGAFEPLRDLLFMRPSQLRPAVSPTGRDDAYVGRLDRDGDTLVMRAIPVSTLASGGPEAVPEHLADAIALQRELFRQIVTTWSTALPKSSAAKEGVAISLEMLGDRSALDTLRSARELADDASRFRLAAAEVIVRLKHLESDDNDEEVALRETVDSLLRSRPKPSVEDSRLLVPLAILAGRCSQASALVVEAPTAPDRRLPLDLNGEAEALTMRRAMGCPATDLSFNALRARLEILAQGNASTVASLLGRAAKLAWPFDTTELRTAAAADYLAKAQVAAVRRDRRAVDSIFMSIDQSRLRAGPMDVTPDAIYGEARTLLALGDTSAAATRLDSFLVGKSRLTPGLLARPTALASLLRIMDLRSSLGHDGAAAAWQKQLATLWADRDRGLPLTIR